ncbi:MAG: hypothetical protein ACE5OO_07780, partial [Candidatus Bathyarchaeia archaeon]
SAGVVSEEELTDTRLRIQAARNALIRNEGESWLRTEAGKEIIGDFSVASIKLLGSVERLQRTEVPDPSLLKDLKAALGEVELHARRLNEETRRRSMVVT